MHVQNETHERSGGQDGRDGRRVVGAANASRPCESDYVGDQIRPAVAEHALAAELDHVAGARILAEPEDLVSICIQHLQRATLIDTADPSRANCAAPRLHAAMGGRIPPAARARLPHQRRRPEHPEADWLQMRAWCVLHDGASHTTNEPARCATPSARAKIGAPAKNSAVACRWHTGDVCSCACVHACVGRLR